MNKKKKIPKWKQQKRYKIPSKKKNKGNNHLLYRGLGVGKRRYKSRMRGKSFLNYSPSPVVIIREGIKSKNKIKRKLREIMKKPPLSSLSYKEYLKTEYWKDLRKLILKRDKWTCQKCKSVVCVQVHHKTYRGRGKELSTDLITLCKRCHEKEHGLYKPNPVNYKTKQWGEQIQPLQILPT